MKNNNEECVSKEDENMINQKRVIKHFKLTRRWNLIKTFKKCCCERVVFSKKKKNKKQVPSKLINGKFDSNSNRLQCEKQGAGF